MPVDSAIRRAARPVGATSEIEARWALAAAQMRDCCGLTRKLLQVENRHAAELLDPIGELVGMFQLLVGVLFKFRLEARREERHRHIGMLLVLQVACDLRRPEAIQRTGDLLRLSVVLLGHRPLRDCLSNLFARADCLILHCWFHAHSSSFQ
jgi:hypothetical protein